MLLEMFVGILRCATDSFIGVRDVLSILHNTEFFHSINFL